MTPLCAAILLAAGMTPAVMQAPASPEAAVEGALQHYADLLRAMDAHGIAQLFTADGEVVNPGQAAVRGPEAIEKFIRQFDDYHVLEYEIHSEKTTVSGQTAVQNGRFRQLVKTPDGHTLEVKGLFQADWIGDPAGVWRIRRMSTSGEGGSQHAATSRYGAPGPDARRGRTVAFLVNFCPPISTVTV